jgi:hypothetical protein
LTFSSSMKINRLLLALSLSAPSCSMDTLLWRNQSIVDDPYIINHLDFVTFHVSSIDPNPIILTNISPSCACVVYLPDPVTTIYPSGSIDLKFLVIHQGQPPVTQKFITLQPSSTKVVTKLSLEVRTPIAPMMDPTQLEWTKKLDQLEWRYTEIVEPADHPEYHLVKIIVDESLIETSIGDVLGADGKPVAGHKRIGTRPVHVTVSGKLPVDAVVMTSMGERVLRLWVVVNEKTDKQILGEF